jgi:hypothetical protein
MRPNSPPFPLYSGLAVIALLTGCSSTTYTCSGNGEYLKAQDRPRLQLPAGVAGSEKLGSGLVVPPPPQETTKLDPPPHCLDEPPTYFGPRKAVATDSVEATVNSWAAAWAAKNAEAVAGLYSQQFQGTEGGAGPFLEQRRQEVETGNAPAPKLEDMNVLVAGTDRRVVTFVQRFGDSAVRKELTLKREAQGWRIVAERTL